MFINSLSSFVSVPFHRHGKLDLCFFAYHDQYEQMHRDYVEAGWTFADVLGSSMGSVGELYKQGKEFYGNDDQTNLWRDDYASDGFLPRAGAVGGWFEEAWVSMRNFPNEAFDEERWFERLGQFFPPLGAYSKFAIGMALRVEVLISQLQAAHSLRLLYCLPTPGRIV